MPIHQRMDNTPFFSRSADNSLLLHLTGEWLAGNLPVTCEEVATELSSRPASRLFFDASSLDRWDSGLLVFLYNTRKLCEQRGTAFTTEGLPVGMNRLLSLVVQQEHHSAIPRTTQPATLPERAADAFFTAGEHMIEMISFLGEATAAFGRLMLGRAHCRMVDFIAITLECGAQALPIVSLISLLVGLIFAFVGAVQLTMFGAQIYVASLVGIAIVRIMGAIMTGIIMAGRTGAAFAARIGTMQVYEEIDALVTLGINPIEFLVLPRILALALMMPLLCLYADLMGILGGLLVGTTIMDLNVMEYYEMTKKAVRLQDFWIGLFHSVVFGVLVALAGCLRGMQCGRDASSVGHAATSAVVTGIVSIICATAVITVICNVLGI